MQLKTKGIKVFDSGDDIGGQQPHNLNGKFLFEAKKNTVLKSETILSSQLRPLTSDPPYTPHAPDLFTFPPWGAYRPQ